MNRRSVDSYASVFVCFCCFMINFLYFSFFRSSNVIFSVLVRQYDFSRSAAFDVIGIMLIVASLTTLFTSYMPRWFTPEIFFIIGTLSGVGGTVLLSFYLTHECLVVQAIMYGFGRGCILNQIYVLLAHHFDRYRATAFGLSAAGFGASNLVFSAVTQKLVDEYTLNGCLLILSGIMLNTLIFVFAIIDDVSSDRVAKETMLQQPDVEVLSRNDTKDLLSNLMLYPLICCGIGFYLLISMLTVVLDIAIDKGVPSDEAYIVSTCYGVTEVISIALSGQLVKNNNYMIRWVIIGSHVCAGVFFIVMIFARGIVHFVPLLLVLTSTAYPGMILSNAAGAHYIGIRLLAKGLGVAHVIGTGIYFALRVLIGHFRDYEKNYDTLLLIAGLMFFGLSLPWFFEPLLIRKKRSQSLSSNL